MMTQEQPIPAPLSSFPTQCPKRLYEPPRLVAFGDLRTLTLGPSAGTGESGNPAIFRA